MSLYAEHVMDHYKHPRKAGTLPDADITFSDENPLCGDRITITVLRGADGKILGARHQTSGCAVCQAGASMLFEDIEGKTDADIAGMGKETILEQFGSALSVSRVKCALLAFAALKKAIGGAAHADDH